MKTENLSLIVVCLFYVLLGSQVVFAEGEELCPLRGKKPSEEDLVKMIYQHSKWLQRKAVPTGKLQEALDAGSSSNFCGADLSNLRSASFEEQSLESVNMRDADLSGLDLSRISLRGANLRGAKLI